MPLDEPNWDPLKYLPLQDRERVRFERTFAALLVNWHPASLTKPEAIIADNGFQRCNEFLAIFFSEDKNANNFISLLAMFVLPHCGFDNGALESAIRYSLRRAITQHEPWIYQGQYSREACLETLDGWDVKPRPATDWLLSLPTERHLVPKAVSDFLSSRVEYSATNKRKGGRPYVADWKEIEKALEAEVRAVGFPGPEHEEGWRRPADVIRWVEKRCGENEPGKEALRINVNAMLERIQGKMTGN